MVKRASKTRVFINGQDVSKYIFSANLPRFPEAVETVELVMEIDKLEVQEDGALVIRIDTIGE